MRTTLGIDDALLRRARKLTAIKETSALVREALDPARGGAVSGAPGRHHA